MKRILLTLLALVIVVGLFAAAGYTGYRMGYTQGLQTTANGDATGPGLRPFDEFGRRGIMPGHDFGFGREFPRGLARGGGLTMMALGVFRLLVPIVLLTLLALFAYWIFTRSGWRLMRTARVTETPPQTVETVETEIKE